MLIANSVIFNAFLVQDLIVIVRNVQVEIIELWYFLVVGVKLDFMKFLIKSIVHSVIYNVKPVYLQPLIAASVKMELIEVS